jgi:putative ABC transport system substrate-binding protein
MRRREFMAGTLGLFVPVPVAGQEPGRRYRIGVVAPNARSLQTIRELTVPELARLGFVEGDNLVLDLRAAPDDSVQGLVEDVVRGRPDLIVAITNRMSAQAQRATSAIPIIMYGGDDLVAFGVADSFRRPGGNATGITIMSVSLDAKRLDILREAAPSARHIAVLVLATDPNRHDAERRMRAVATAAGVELSIFLVSKADEFPAAFARMRQTGAQALAITAQASFFAETPLLVRLASEAGLPTICEWREMAEQGCLLSYGPSRKLLFARVADYAARILRGANPGELPIEQPSAFEFVVNVRVAKALGLTIPPTFLAGANEGIE